MIGRSDPELSLTWPGIDTPITAIVEHNSNNPGDPNDIRADFPLGDFQLQPGMQLTVTDGNTPRTLTLTALEITNIDTEADTISGTTDSSDWVRVCVNQPGNCVTRWATPDGEGNWTVDYTIASGPDDDTASVNLKPGMDGWAEQYDTANNATHADWKLLNPFMEASVGSNWVQGRDWPVGSELTLTIAETRFFR